MGRPTLYNDKLADQICEKIALGESLKQICNRDDLPCRDTVFQWRHKNPSFSDKYSRAVNQGVDIQIERMIDEIEDFKLSEDRKVANAEVQKLRLKIDTLKWIAAKVLPKKYGDKLQVEHGLNLDNIDSAVRQALDRAKQHQIPDQAVNSSSNKGLLGPGSE